MSNFNDNGQGVGFGFVTLNDDTFFIDTALNRGSGLDNFKPSGTQFFLSMNRPEFRTTFPNLIRLELAQFNMRRTWWNVNAYNNVFWIQLPTCDDNATGSLPFGPPQTAPNGQPAPAGWLPTGGTPTNEKYLRNYPLRIPEGLYKTFEELSIGIQIAFLNLFYFPWDPINDVNIPVNVALPFFNTKLGSGFTDPFSGVVYPPNPTCAFQAESGGVYASVAGLWCNVEYDQSLRQFQIFWRDPSIDATGIAVFPVPVPPPPSVASFGIPIPIPPTQQEVQLLDFACFSPQTPNDADLADALIAMNLKYFQTYLYPPPPLFHFPPSTVSDVIPYPNGSMCDSWKLLGGFVSRPNLGEKCFRDGVEYFDPNFPPAPIPIPGTMIASNIPPQLSTMDAIYIRTTLISTDFMTQGFTTDPVADQGHIMIPTDIFAEIPLKNNQVPTLFVNDGTLGDIGKVEFYDEFGAMGVNIDTNQIIGATFSITDEKGRLLPEAGLIGAAQSGQAKTGNQTCSMVLRYKIINLPTAMVTRLKEEGLEGAITANYGFTIGSGGGIIPSQSWGGGGKGGVRGGGVDTAS